MALRTPGLTGVLLPAVRDAGALEEAIGLGYRQLLLERGSLLSMAGVLAAAARRGIAIFVNLDGVEGLAHDSAALAFLATDLLLSGVVSVKPGLLREAGRFRLRTVQRIHAIDSTGLETGLNNIVSPAPYAIAIAPGVAVGQVIQAVRGVTDVPLWGTGFITTTEQAKGVLSAGAAVVSTSRISVWRDLALMSLRD